MPHFCIYSGTAGAGAFWAAPSGGFDGGGGGVAFAEGVCNSSRATAEVESRRRVPLALGSCRTHLRQVVNCRIDGVAAMAGGWLGVVVPSTVLLENVVMAGGPCPETSASNSATST